MFLLQNTSFPTVCRVNPLTAQRHTPMQIGQNSSSDKSAIILTGGLCTHLLLIWGCATESCTHYPCSCLQWPQIELSGWNGKHKTCSTYLPMSLLAPAATMSSLYLSYTDPQQQLSTLQLTNQLAFLRTYVFQTT